jgi:uncharacterized protein (TIGR02646 family)
MEFIKRSDEPEHLIKNKKKWTKPWVDYYHKKRDQEGKLIREKKPSDNHWTNDKIRKFLISDFKNNCGYCGCSRPTPRSAPDEETSPRGHVDHYKAKAIHPELTYEWSNYIWSCEACNVEKGEFDDPNAPILNPCQWKDCVQLIFIIDSGKYCLHNDIDPYNLRLINTDQQTMLNSDEIAVRRRNRVKNIKNLFHNVAIILKINSELTAQIINENIDCIKKDLEDTEFYFLIQKNYQDLRKQHPNIAQLIDNYRF